MKGFGEEFVKTTASKLPVVGGIMALMLACASPAPAQQMLLPPSDQLVTMTIQDRLALYHAMQALPQNERDANLNALRAEIETLTPEQKQQMRLHFAAEFKSLPTDQQQQVMHELNIATPEK